MSIQKTLLGPLAFRTSNGLREDSCEKHPFLWITFCSTRWRTESADLPGDTRCVNTSPFCLKGRRMNTGYERGRIAYPTLPGPLTARDLWQRFTPWPMRLANKLRLDNLSKRPSGTGLCRDPQFGNSVARADNA